MKFGAARAAIKKFRAEPVKQEPVAWASMIGQYAHISWGSQRPDDEIHRTPLYAAPMQRVDNYYLEQMAEDAECVKLSLDKAGVPTFDESGKVYSLWGRVCRYAAPVDAKAIQAEALEEAAKVCESLRPSKQEFDRRFWDGCTESAAVIRARMK